MQEACLTQLLRTELQWKNITRQWKNCIRQHKNRTRQRRNWTHQKSNIIWGIGGQKKKLRAQIKKKIWMRIIIWAKKRLQTCLKRKKRHVIVMFVSMNAINTSFIQHMNAREKKQLYTSVICKSFWQSTYITIKKINIILWLIKNPKDVQHTRNWKLYI